MPGAARRSRHVPAAAAASVQPMLDHGRGDRRDVVHLAAHHARLDRVGQVSPTARARVGNVVNNLVRVIHLQQCSAAHPWLLTRAAPAAPPGQARHRRRRPVGRRRLRTVARVAPQPAPELRDLDLQRLDPLGLLTNQPGLPLDQHDKLLARRLPRPGHPT